MKVIRLNIIVLLLSTQVLLGGNETIIGHYLFSTICLQPYTLEMGDKEVVPDTCLNNGILRITEIDTVKSYVNSSLQVAYVISGEFSGTGRDIDCIPFIGQWGEMMWGRIVGSEIEIRVKGRDTSHDIIQSYSPNLELSGIIAGNIIEGDWVFQTWIGYGIAGKPQTGTFVLVKCQNENCSHR